MATERVLEDFIGVWEITREVIEGTGARARFAGQAVWTATGHGAHYAETGVLRLESAPPMTAERRYVWHPDLSVYFEDGRFFHRVPASGGQATHFCDPDTYDVDYDFSDWDFSDWPQFRLSYVVRGPRKDYTLRSHYRRVG
jgi:hypothetical protein